MLRPSTDRRNGTSLLEVLISTAIFIGSLVALNQLMTTSTQLALQARDRSMAVRLCESKLNEFCAGVESVSGSGSGDFEEEPDWEWVSSVTSDSTAANLYKVSVTVRRTNTNNPLETTITQYVFDFQQRGQLPPPPTTAVMTIP